MLCRSRAFPLRVVTHVNFEGAFRMVREAIAENGGQRHGVITRVAIQLGIGSERLRNWVKRAEIER